MTLEELITMRAELAMTATAEMFDPGTLSDCILAELVTCWDVLPHDTKAVFMGVSATMKRHSANEMMSDIEAQTIVHDLRKGKQG